VKPGTYVNVVFQNRPPSSPPPFVAALIGRTSADKPTSKTLVRNSVPSQTVTYDPDTNVITVTSGDVDETARRDILQTDDSDITSLGANSILTDDVSFQQYFWGYEADWVRADAAPLKAYIEWILDYGVVAVGTSPIFAGKANAGTFIIQLARATGDPNFVDSVFTTECPPVSLDEGLHNTSGGFRLNKAAAVYTLAIDGGTPVTITTGGQAITGADSVVRHRYTVSQAVGKDVEILVDRTQLLATFGTLPDADYDNNVTLITRGPLAGTGSDPLNIRTIGTKYDIAYKVNKALSDFVPVAFDNLADLQEFHGTTIDATTKNDALSVGAAPYFSQGGLTVYTVPLKDKVLLGTDGYDLDEPTGSGYVAAVEDALTLLEDVAIVSMILPLSPSEPINGGNYRPGILNAVLSHVNRMSAIAMGKPRMSIMGARAGTTDENVFITAATTMSSNRIVYMAPATASLAIGSVTKIVDGSLIASAVAGILSSGVNAGEPISSKQLTAFIDIPDPFTRVQKDRIGGTYGVTVVEKDNGASVIRHFLTTNPSSSLTAEGKITVIEIDVRRSLEAGLNATLINTRLVNGQTIGSARTIIGLILNQKIAVQIINAFEIIKLEKDPLEPRQLNVELAIRPVFDLNWIYIKATFLAS
jgi:hypothetical protein